MHKSRVYQIDSADTANLREEAADHLLSTVLPEAQRQLLGRTIGA